MTATVMCAATTYVRRPKATRPSWLAIGNIHQTRMTHTFNLVFCRQGQHTNEGRLPLTRLRMDSSAAVIRDCTSTKLVA